MSRTEQPCARLLLPPPPPHLVRLSTAHDFFYTRNLFLPVSVRRHSSAWAERNGLCRGAACLPLSALPCFRVLSRGDSAGLDLVRGMKPPANNLSSLVLVVPVVA